MNNFSEPMNTYFVEKEIYQKHINAFIRRKIFMFFLLAAIPVSVQGFIANWKAEEFPVWTYVIIALLIFIPYCYMMSKVISNMKQLSNAHFYMDDLHLAIRFENDSKQEFLLKEITMIRRKRHGTVLFVGRSRRLIAITKQSNDSDTQPKSLIYVFIPKIVSNYDELVESLENASENAIIV
jgi:hypothetical protein